MQGIAFLIVSGKKVNGKWDIQVDGPSGGFFPQFVAEDSAKRMAEENSSAAVLDTFGFKNGYISGQRTQDVEFESGVIEIHNKGIMVTAGSVNVFYVPFVRMRELGFETYLNGQRQRDIRIYFDYRDGSSYGFLHLDFSDDETVNRAASAINSRYNTWKVASGLNPPRIFSNKLASDSDVSPELSAEDGGSEKNPLAEEQAIPSNDKKTEESTGKFEGEIHPETRSKVIIESDVSNWSKEQIQFALNEMFARHGLYFRKNETRDLFNKHSWYRPDPTLTMDKVEEKFSEIEKRNLKFLGALRNKPN